MKKLIYTIFLVVAFQFAQGQEVLSINYYNPDNQQQIPLENLTLVLPEGDNFNFPMIAVLKNTGTQIISTGDTIFTKINFNGRNINVFFAITQNVNVGITASLRFYLPFTRSEVIEGERANVLCSEVIHIIYSGVHTPFTQTPVCANFTIIEPGASVEDIDISNEVTIFPNPVSDKLKINNMVKSTDVSIYNTTGQQVYTVSSAIGNIEIDLSNLSPGIYFVKMQNDKDISTKKIQVVK